MTNLVWCRRAAVSLGLALLACGDPSTGSEDTDEGEEGTDETSTGDESTGGDTSTGFFDDCPDDPEKLVPGQCGCGEPDDDMDQDGHADCVDTCLEFPNSNQVDSDGDGLGDPCDPCPDDEDTECACVPGGATCTDGMADMWPCLDVDLRSFRDLNAFGTSQMNDVWGWADPATSREYAIVGLDIGIAFVDVTDPECTSYVGILPTHSLPVNWRDTKDIDDVLYVVSEAEGHGMQMFDLTMLADVVDPPVVFAETAHYDDFFRGHNLAINPDFDHLYMFDGDACENGIYVADISERLAPEFRGCYDTVEVHDAHCVTYHGPDTEHDGKPICVTANGGDLSMGVVDMSDPTTPLELSRVPYEGAFFAHQGWLTDDHAYFMLGDEADELAGVMTTTYLWDVSDLDAPVHMGNHVAETMATDHNMFVLDGRLYQANYHAGLRILDLAEIADAKLTEIAFFDTYPPSDAEGFGTTWGLYPYLPSGNVLLTSEGLFVVTPSF